MIASYGRRFIWCRNRSTCGSFLDAINKPIVRLATSRGYEKPREESVMKCANPDCNRGIGLVAHRRGWFSKRRYCSRICRDAFVTKQPKRSQQQGSAANYVEWLFLQSAGYP